MVGMQVRVTGPLLTDPAEFRKRLASAPQIINWALGVRGSEILRRETRVFKHPTGHWKSQIRVRRHPDWVEIRNPVIYSRWLEHGSPATTFSGYQLMERTGNQLQREAGRLAQTTFDELMGFA